MSKYIWQQAMNLSEATVYRVAKTRGITLEATNQLLEPFNLRLNQPDFEAVERLIPSDARLYINPFWRRLVFWAIRPEVFFADNETSGKVFEICQKTVTNASGYTHDYRIYDVGEALDTPCHALRCQCISTSKIHWILLPTYARTVVDALNYIYSEAGSPNEVIRHGDVLLSRKGQGMYPNTWQERIVKEA